MTVMSDSKKQRRLLLEWMSASPLLALPGVPWAQDAAKRPDPMIWPATIAHEAIASPKDAINVFYFEPVASSARNNSDCGIVIPSALAALRLIVSTNRVGCSTGISLGLAPFKILSTK